MTAHTEPELLSDSQLAVLSEAEKTRYANSLLLYEAMRSPMSYGVYCSDMIEYAHVVHTDKIVMAALEGRLYKTGVGPRAVFSPDPERPLDENEGSWTHPVTGEDAIFTVCLSKPPRHGKSYHISEHLPAWFLTKYPDLEVILASYDKRLAATFGEKARNLIKDHPEFGISLRSDSKSKYLWKADGHRGQMLSAGRDSGISGIGLNLGIIDDPVKDAIEALSPVTQVALANFWEATFSSRRMPHQARLRMLYPEKNHPDIFTISIVMATRWHQNDMWGYLRKNIPEQCYFVNMPARAFQLKETKDYGDPGVCVLGREPGDPLEPSRYNRMTLSKVESGEKGRFWFNALWQGVPRIEAGGIIPNKFGRYSVRQRTGESELIILSSGLTIDRAECYEYATVDTALTTKNRSDYSVYAHWLATPGPNRQLLLWAIHRQKLEGPEIGDWLKRLNDLYKPSYVGIEAVASGLRVIQDLRKNHGGLSIRPLKADTDKISRALPFGDLVAANRVEIPDEETDYVPPGDPDWVEEWIDEHITFPTSSHDDQVDTSAYSAIQFNMLPSGFIEESQRPRTMQQKMDAQLDRVVSKRENKEYPGWMDYTNPYGL